MLIVRKVRFENAEGVAHVHASSWKTTYAGHFPDDFLNGMANENHLLRWKKHCLDLSADNATSMLYILENDSKIIGFGEAGKRRESKSTLLTTNPEPEACKTSNHSDYTAEIYGIYLLKSEQRKGAGSLLMKKLVHALQSSNHRSMMLWVLKTSPYRKFYEKIGGLLLREMSSVNVSKQDFPVVSYGWSDLSDLYQRLDRVQKK